MEKWYQRKKFRHFLAEAMLIVLSVLLALFLNEYRSHIKDDKARAKAEENIAQELEKNKEILVEYLPYHQNLLKSLGETIPSDSAVNALITPMGLDLLELAPRGIMQEFPNSAAWETIRSNSLMSDVNYSLLYALTDTYNQQERTIQVLDGLIDVALSREALDPEQARPTLILLLYQMRELVGRESLLLQKYNESLAMLEKEDF
jgi:hypothetical protein